MTFQVAGRQWDTSEMKTFETNDPYIKSIYLAEDRVFVAAADVWEGIIIRPAQGDEITLLASRFGIDELWGLIRGKEQFPDEQRADVYLPGFSDMWIG